MEKIDSGIIEATPERTNGSTGDFDESGRPVQAGDIIEGNPEPRTEFREFPNLRTTAQTTGERTNKRRGRPPGTRNTATVATQTQKNLDGIERLLMSIHLGIATVTGWPEAMLDPKEAQQESEAIQTWAKEYGKVVDPKTMATLNLIGTIGFIEGTRAVAIMTRLRDERKKEQSAARNGSGPTPIDVKPDKEGRTPPPPPAAKRKEPTPEEMHYMLNPLVE